MEGWEFNLSTYTSDIIDPFHCHAIKNKSKTIQWKKLRNCDVIDDKKIGHFSKF